MRTVAKFLFYVLVALAMIGGEVILFVKATEPVAKQVQPWCRDDNGNPMPPLLGDDC